MDAEVYDVCSAIETFFLFDDGETTYGAAGGEAAAARGRAAGGEIARAAAVAAGGASMNST